MLHFLVLPLVCYFYLLVGIPSFLFGPAKRTNFDGVGVRPVTSEKTMDAKGLEAAAAFVGSLVCWLVGLFLCVVLLVLVCFVSFICCLLILFLVFFVCGGEAGRDTLICSKRIGRIE